MKHLILLKVQNNDRYQNGIASIVYKFFDKKEVPLKFIGDHFYVTVIHKGIFLNWNVTSLPYLEMLLISMIKLLFLFFLIDRNV